MGPLAASSSVSGSSSATSSENALSQSESTNLANDTWSLLKPSMSTTDIERNVNSLNQEKKYNFLKCHFVQSDIFHFPQGTQCRL